jgi:hypothetical protein
VKRGPLGGSNFPELSLEARPILDHNGAGLDRGMKLGLRGADLKPTNTLNLQYPKPSQLIVDGKPLEDMSGVAVLSTHGAREGIVGFGLGVQKAAKFVADELLASRASGKPLDKVVLNACEQRDFRWFSFDSSAQSFAKALNAQLARAGHPPVRVLAPENPGSVTSIGEQSTGTLVRIENGRLRFGRESVRGRYTPAEDGPRFRFGLREGMVAGAVAADQIVPPLVDAYHQRFVEVE